MGRRLEEKKKNSKCKRNKGIKVTRRADGRSGATTGSSNTSVPRVQNRETKREGRERERGR